MIKTFIKLLTFILPVMLLAQSPGGISNNMTVWFRADAGTTGSPVQTWTNQATNVTLTSVTQATAANRAALNLGGYNFNPTLTFDGVNDNYSIASIARTAFVNTNRYNFYVVSRPRNLDAGRMVIGHFTSASSRFTFEQVNQVFHNNVSSLFTTVSINNPSLAEASFTGSALNWGSNGLSGSNAFSTIMATGNATFYIGTQTGGNFFYNGDIAEIIIYNEANLVTDHSRIRSYLALKYGITLDNQSYIASDGTTRMWDDTKPNATTYNKNIAGIGRDNNSAPLNQKQSQSQNPGIQPVIAAGNFVATNADNTSTLTDMEFLSWGDNNGAKSFDTSIVSPGNVANRRFSAIWKVQKTAGFNNTVTVAIPVTSSNPVYLVRSTNDTFDAADTWVQLTQTTVNGVQYWMTPSQINLADGEYFTFATYAYAPAGVSSGIARWYRSDRGVTLDTGRVSTLVDQVSNSETITQATATRRPAYNSTSNFINFNPNMVFTPNPHTALNSMTGGFAPGTTGLTSFSVAVPSASTLGQRKYIFGMSNVSQSDDVVATNTTMIAVGNTLCGNSATPNIGKWRNCNPYVNTGSWVAGMPSIITAGSRPAPNNISFFAAQNGNVAATGNGAVAMNYTQTGFGLGSAGDNYNDTSVYGWSGQISEVILYGGELSETDQRRVDSYLAIKHGITLGRVETNHYLGSTASPTSIVWNGADNTAYNKNIFGIARSDIGDFEQKVSKSINTGTIITVATDDNYISGNTDASRTSLTTNETYSLIGDNEVTGTTNIASNEYRVNRVWRVQTTGSNVNPWLQANLSEYRFSSNVEMWIADDENFTTNLVRIPANSYTSNLATFNTTFTQGVRYFTFSGYIHAPGGVIGQGAWFRADAGVTLSGTAITRWDNQGNAASLPYVDNTGTSATNRVTYNDNNVNFNPGLSFPGDNTDAFLRRTGTNVAEIASTSSYAHFTVARKRAANSNVVWHAGGVITSNGPKVGVEINSASPFNANFYINTNTFRSTTPVTNNANNLFVISRIFSAGTANDFDNGAIGTAAAANHNGTGGVFTIGAEGYNQYEFAGDIMEIISYPATITLADREKVNAYLGIKYGVTLGTAGNPFTYSSSTGTAVWNPANNTGYYNNVFGIGRDDISTLYQKQSRSENTSQKLIIGAGSSLANTNVANANTLTNGQFLMVGDNGLAQSYSTMITNTLFQRFNAIWKVQNTNSVGTVTVAWPQDSSINLVQSPDASIESTDTFTPMTGTATIGGVTYNTATVNLSDGTYFTFARELEDTDGDGVPDIIDLDNDNDGILDADECNGSDKITNGTFPTSGGFTSTVPGWTVAGGTVNLGANGLLFHMDGGSTTTLSQNLSGLTQYNKTIQLNDLYWVKTNTGGNGEGDATARGVLTISYGGTIYATIDLGTGSTPSVVANNGATSSISTLPAVIGTPGTSGTLSAKTNMSLTLPSGIPANGLLEFKFVAGSHTNQVRDIGLRSVSLMACADTDGDGTPDYLDLDSDDDGCFDALEGAGNITRDQINLDGSIAGAVDANGVPVLANGGQGVGDSRNAAVNGCPPSCTKPGATGTSLTSSVGILTKGEPSVIGWPESVPNGYLVLDGAFKGMVITHMTTAQINALTPTEGMLVFDTDLSCVKLYRGTSTTVQPGRTGWVCIERICID